MLKKLYKHEFWGLCRGILPLCGTLLAAATVSKLLLTLSGNIDNFYINTMATSATLIYGLGIFAAFAVGVAMIIIRFYKHLLSGEGYLTFSLPISPTQHIVCKLICAIVMILLVSVAAIASLVIMFLGTVDFSGMIRALPETLQGINNTIGTANFTFYCIEFAILLLVSIAEGILKVYCAVAIGQNFKNRVGGAVVSYLVIHVAVQTVQTFFILILFTAGKIYDNINVFTIPHIILWLMILWSSVLLTAYFLITRYMLNKRLNLE